MIKMDDDDKYYLFIINKYIIKVYIRDRFNKRRMDKNII